VGGGRRRRARAARNQQVVQSHSIGSTKKELSARETLLRDEL
jgi:hypothetical protein